MELKLGQPLVFVDHLMSRLGLGMKAKLILLFIIIKVVPLVLLALLAWNQALHLGEDMLDHTGQLSQKSHESLRQTGEIAVSDATQALDDRATEDIERLTTGIARRVADFLYSCDSDILFAASIKPDPSTYQNFIKTKDRLVVKTGDFLLSPDKKMWFSGKRSESLPKRSSSLKENEQSFNYFPPEFYEREKKPQYLEMTFLDTSGQEIIKQVSSSRMNSELKDVSDRRNTYCRAETYFSELKKLKPGEIYVSEVIGAYVPSKVIGIYTPESAAKAGEKFRPEESAYAGYENPLGKRFKGIVRWAAPVTENGEIIGFVTLALDHDHLMEFTDHIRPTAERYTEIPDAGDGNYAFIWDHKGRSIVHPRHFSIAGYNPQTGDPEIPWLEDRIYDEWQASGLPYVDFIKSVPTFVAQSVKRKPAPNLTRSGLVGLDCRYLNFAPQCTGWFDLTEDGGSGSFVILWSGLKKLTTAAAIPYYTGQYGASARGFGFVTIGAEVEDFHLQATETKKKLDALFLNSDAMMHGIAKAAQQAIDRNLFDTAVSLAGSTSVMAVLVILIAIWMASAFTGKIRYMINGISRFCAGERHFRFNAPIKDEMGVLADSFDDMADNLEASVRDTMVIIDIHHKIIYANEATLKIFKKTLPEVIGAKYEDHSLLTNDPRSCPITAMLEDREAEAIYVPEQDKYYKGSATFLTDKHGRLIGYIITASEVTMLIYEQNNLKKARKDLEKAVLEANRANESKSEFLARMSHEIRTPMNAIIGITGIVRRRLEDGRADPAEIKSKLTQLENSSQHLMGLLNDILDISKIEAGKITVSRERFDLPRLVENVASIIRPRCQEKNIEFIINLKVKQGSVYGDPLLLRQVLINLLGNAVKFTPDCGKVFFDVSCEKIDVESGFFRFSVRDTGIGMNREHQEKLFKPFEQLNGRKFSGTGLGLSISQKIVNLFGGKIIVKSIENEGSEFYFSIRLDFAAEENQTQKRPENGVSLAGKRILLVDDVDINRIIVLEILNDSGFVVEEAIDGEDALEQFRNSPEGFYDLILMDVQMPRMNGYEATSAIRSLRRADASVPIIAMTANAFKEDVDKALASGMNAHMAKPLEHDRLIEVISTYLAN